MVKSHTNNGAETMNDKTKPPLEVAQRMLAALEQMDADEGDNIGWRSGVIYGQASLLRTLIASGIITEAQETTIVVDPSLMGKGWGPSDCIYTFARILSDISGLKVVGATHWGSGDASEISDSHWDIAIEAYVEDCYLSWEG
jgi:hypothetical protein